MLYWQNQTGNWESWAYAWALIPGFVGVGTIVMGLWEGKWADGARRPVADRSSARSCSSCSARCWAACSAATWGFIAKWWPVALILLGVLSLIDYVDSAPAPRREGVQMRNTSVFWAVVLILVGVLFLLNNFGLLPHLGFSIWNLIWPIFLIALGVWFISRTFMQPAPAEMEPGSIPLDGASRAEIELQHGAGELRLAAGASAGVLAEGVIRRRAALRGEAPG